VLSQVHHTVNAFEVILVRIGKTPKPPDRTKSKKDRSGPERRLPHFPPLSSRHDNPYVLVEILQFHVLLHHTLPLDDFRMSIVRDLLHLSLTIVHIVHEQNPHESFPHPFLKEVKPVPLRRSRRIRANT
jgi:hypothetical protein